jgi:hypothetical protein
MDMSEGGEDEPIKVVKNYKRQVRARHACI